MRVIAISTLRAFWTKHSDAQTPLMAWYALASRSQWRSPSDIKEAYRNASFTANNRVVFNIKGNDYRLVVLARYDKGLLFVKFVGTHAQYDKIDASTV